MDNTDKKILEILSNDAYSTTTEISKVINLSIPATNKRIQKMQNDDIIRSFTVLTNEKKIGKPIIAYILIVVRYGDNIKDLLNYIEKDPDVLECYAVTGEYDYIIKVCAKSVEALENKLLNFKKQKGVVKSHTMLTLMEHKFKPSILPDADETIDIKE